MADDRIRCWAAGARAGLSLKELENDLVRLQYALRGAAKKQATGVNVAFFRSHAQGRIDDLDADAAASDECGPPGAVSWTDDWRRWRPELDVSENDPGKYTGMLVKIDQVTEVFRRGVAEALGSRSKG